MKNAGLKGIILSAAMLSGCMSLEDMISDTEIGKMADFYANQFVANCENKYEIEDFGYFDRKDEAPEEPILFFIHGWSSGINEITNDNGGESMLDVMDDVFNDRVLIANYSSNPGVKEIFAGLEKPFLDFVEKYSRINGRDPRIIIAGHSLGSDIARQFSIKYPEYIKDNGIINGVCDGVTCILPDFASEFLIGRIRSVMEREQKPFSMNDCQSVRDLITGSSFLNDLNRHTKPLNVGYNFYAFVSANDNLLIPGEDDGVTRLDSAYPYKLIQEGKFEDVKIGNVIIFRGGDHFSIRNNPEILRQILISLKSDNKQYSSKAPSPSLVKNVFIAPSLR